MSEGYNGWRNYETWSWNLIVDNDDSLQRHVRGIVSQFARELKLPAAEENLKNWIKREVDTDSLEDKLKDWTQECFEGEDFVSPLGLLLSQLLQSSIQEIDFREIAVSLLVDYLESQG